jgi:uncharacterized protein (DUF58 family)
VRLTPAGGAVLIGSVVLYTLGLAVGYGELHVIAIAGLVVLLLAVGWTAWRPGIELERAVVPPRVVRGEPAEAQLTITNPGRRSLPPLLARDQVGNRPVDALLPRTAAGTTCRASFPLPTARRGVVDVGPLRVLRQDPLGLTQSSKVYGDVETLWVYPRVHRVAPLSSGKRRDLEGPTQDGVEGTVTFHALREYVTGDDLRLIHWRSTARTGTLMVRQQADPSQPQTTIVLDTQVRSYEGDAFEDAVEAAASLVVASTSRRFPVRLLTGGGLLATGQGRGSRSGGTSGAAALLEHLTPLQPSDAGSLAEAAGRLATQPGGNTLVVISGTPDPMDLMAVETLRNRYLTMAVLRFQPGVVPGLSWDQGVVDLVAPTSETFAALWNDRT